MQLQFERKLPRAVPVANDALSSEEQFHDAEFVLYVSCAWRLEGADVVVCSSGDVERDALAGGQHLEQLVGKRVTGTDVHELAADVVVNFEGGYRLHLFCDEPIGYTNYSLLGPSAVHSVKAPSSVVVQERRLGSLDS